MHYHIISWNDKFGIISHIRYHNGIASVIDYCDIIYNIFADELDQEQKPNSIIGLATVVDEGQIQHVAHTSEKISLSWVVCDGSPCKFAQDN